MLSRGTFEVRIHDHAFTIHLGWLIAVIAVAIATLASFAPTQELEGETVAWYAGGVLLIAGFFTSIVLHELAHATLARRLGHAANTRVRLYPFGGTGDRFDDPGTPGRETLVALAGPLLSAAIGGVLFGLWVLIPDQLALARRFLYYLALANLGLAALNLLPGYPLDGGRVLRALVWYLHDDLLTGTRVAVSYAQIISLFGLAIGTGIAATGGVTGIWGLWLLIVAWGLNRSARDELTRTFFVVTGAQHSAGETIEGMNPRIAGDTTLDEVIELLLAGAQPGPALVVDGERVVGVLTLSQLRHVRRADWSQRTAAETMVPIGALPQVDHRTTVRELLNWLQELDSDALVVTDDGAVLGAIDRHLAVHRLLDRARDRHRLRN